MALSSRWGVLTDTKRPTVTKPITPMMREQRAVIIISSETDPVNWNPNRIWNGHQQPPGLAGWSVRRLQVGGTGGRLKKEASDKSRRLDRACPGTVIHAVPLILNTLHSYQHSWGRPPEVWIQKSQLSEYVSGELAGKLNVFIL